MGLSPRAVELLRTVHDHPGTTRAEAARNVGIGSGAATELVAQLCDAGLLAERPAERTGARGRPTTVLVPHPQGPLVLAVSITHETWRLQAVELGGTPVADVGEGHTDRDSAVVLADLCSAAARLRRRYPRRVRAIAVSAPGTVRGTRLLHATNPTWRDVDLRAMWPRADVFVAGNDATLAGAAESARGAAVGATVALHLRVEAGVGGVVIERGVVQVGAHGLAGEFGHMPVGDSKVQCACGATGCWGTAVDGGALARLLGRRVPRDSVAFTRRVIAASDEASRSAVQTVAGAFGRGIAGLVNALDPDVVTVGGSGADLLRAAPGPLAEAYRAGLMHARWPDPPVLREAALGEDGPLVGAAEQAWAALWPTL